MPRMLALIVLSLWCGRCPGQDEAEVVGRVPESARALRIHKSEKKAIVWGRAKTGSIRLAILDIGSGVCSEPREIPSGTIYPGPDTFAVVRGYSPTRSDSRVRALLAGHRIDFIRYENFETTGTIHTAHAEDPRVSFHNDAILVQSERRADFYDHGSLNLVKSIAGPVVACVSPSDIAISIPSPGVRVLGRINLDRESHRGVRIGNHEYAIRSGFLTRRISPIRLRVLRDHSTGLLPGRGRTRLKHRTVGGTAPFVWSVVESPGVSIDSETGVVSLDNRELTSRARRMLGEKKTGLNRTALLLNSAVAGRRCLHTVFGQQAKGIPVGIPLTVTVTDAERNKTRVQYCVFVDVPLAPIAAEISGAEKKTMRVLAVEAKDARSLHKRLDRLQKRIEELEVRTDKQRAGK